MRRSDIIDGMRQCEKGNRRIDCWLAMPLAFNHTAEDVHGRQFSDVIREFGPLSFSEADADSWGIPHYSTSIDAALSKKPLGWGRSVDATLPEAGIDVVFYPMGLRKDEFKGTHKEEAMATCMALLLVMNDQQGGDGDV